VVGVRPEDLVAAEPETAMLRGVVRTVEFLGSRSLLRADVGAVLATAFVPADLGFAVGASIGLSPMTDAALHWFDLATGQRMEAGRPPLLKSPEGR
jgi:hypothetical protein